MKMIAVLFCFLFIYVNAQAGILTKEFELYLHNKTRAIVLVERLTGTVTHVWQNNKWRELEKISKNLQRSYQHLYNLQKDMDREKPKRKTFSYNPIVHKEFTILLPNKAKAPILVEKLFGKDDVTHVWKNGYWVELSSDEANRFQHLYDLQKEKIEPDKRKKIDSYNILLHKEFKLILPNRSKRIFLVERLTGKVTHIFQDAGWVRLSENPRRYYQNVYNLQKDFTR